MNKRTKRLLVPVVAVILVLVLSFLTFAEGDLGESLINDEQISEELATAADEELEAEASEVLDEDGTEETSEDEEWSAEDINVFYRLFSEEAGWTELVSDGSSAETGEASAFEIVLSETEGLEVLFSAYVLGNGWTSWKSGDDSAQLNNTVSAVRMTLSGDKADYYDIYYSVKLSDGLWTDWACNASEAGSMSDCVITGIRVDVVLAGSEFDTKVINDVSEEAAPEETEAETIADEIAEPEDEETEAVVETPEETETSAVEEVETEVETDAVVETPEETEASVVEEVETEAETEAVVEAPIEETEAVVEASIEETKAVETENVSVQETEAVVEETSPETEIAAAETVPETAAVEIKHEDSLVEGDVQETVAAEPETAGLQGVETQVQVVSEVDEVFEDEDEEEVYVGGFHTTTEEDEADIILANQEGASSNYTDLTYNGSGKVSTINARKNTHLNICNGKLDLLAVADTQVGYYRKENTDTKYGIWYGYPDSKWCAMFVSWCCDQANIAPYTIKPYCRCSSEATWFKEQNRWKNPAGYTPKMGDIIFFHYNSSTINHTGIVSEAKNGYVYCIEGNNNNSVNRTRHKLTASYISGYGTPDYAASDAKIKYSVHVKTYGWLDSVVNGVKAGTTGQARRMEAIKISINEKMPYSGNIEYSVYVKDKGWLSWVKNGKQAGTTGQYRRMEAIKIKLTGKMAKNYDVYYRVHIENYGWLGWAKNGAVAGSVGKGLRMEAIEIQLIPKGGTAPGKEAGACLK